MLDYVKDGAEVGVVESGGALGFLEQAFAVGFSGPGVRRHALDGDKALQRGVFCAVNLSHAPRAQALGDHKAADSGAGEGIRSRVDTSSRRARLDLICHGRGARRIL